MIGRAEDLAMDVPLPDGVTLRRVTGPDDVRRTVAMQDEVFGDPRPGMADELIRRLAEQDDGARRSQDREQVHEDSTPVRPQDVHTANP